MQVAHVLGVCFALALSAHAQEGANLTPSSCEKLASMQLPNATVTSASQVGPGAFTAPGAARPMAALPAFCRVALTAKPTADSDIKVEVWLPVSGWNGKFQAVGNGG